VRGFCEVQVHALCGCTKLVIVQHCNAKSLRAALHCADVFALYYRWAANGTLQHYSTDKHKRHGMSVGYWRLSVLT
jgi:hypothetical protein